MQFISTRLETVTEFRNDHGYLLGWVVLRPDGKYYGVPFQGITGCAEETAIWDAINPTEAWDRSWDNSQRRDSGHANIWEAALSLFNFFTSTDKGGDHWHRLTHTGTHEERKRAQEWRDGLIEWGDISPAE